MSGESDIYLRCADLIRRISWRLPGRMIRDRMDHNLRDWLFFQSAISTSRAGSLDAAWLACESDEDWFAFASKVFPAHQQRSEILGFISFAREHRPRVVMEIGTAQGGTNFLLGRLFPSAESVLGVDLFVFNKRLLKRYRREGVSLSFIEGSSHDPAILKRVRDILNGRPIDVLLIDGDHSYAGVREDFRIYRDLVREGGIIAFHDIVSDSEGRHGVRTGNWVGDVPKYWEALNPHYEARTFVDSPEQDGFGIGAIIHRKDGRVPE